MNLIGRWWCYVVINYPWSVTQTDNKGRRPHNSNVLQKTYDPWLWLFKEHQEIMSELMSGRVSDPWLDYLTAFTFFMHGGTLYTTSIHNLLALEMDRLLLITVRRFLCACLFVYPSWWFDSTPKIAYRLGKTRMPEDMKKFVLANFYNEIYR